MAQYIYITDGTNYVYTDGVSTFRLNVRSGIEHVLYIDQEITDTGFSGDQGTDWDVIESFEIPEEGGIGFFRIGVRDEHFVIDDCYDPYILGYYGAEDFDWLNIEKFQL